MKDIRTEDHAEYSTQPAHKPISDREREDATIASAIQILDDRLHIDGAVLTSPEATRDYLRLRLRAYPYEVFACLFLSNRNAVIEYVEIFRGTIDGASVHPREVVREAIRTNAAAVILAHNHPSGVAEPSMADLRITGTLTDALKLIDVRVLDHMIVGDGAVTSLAERGLI